MIKLQKYKLNNITLSEEILSLYINQFWEDIFSKITSTDKPKHLLLMCKVLLEDEALGYRTLGHLRKVNYSDKDLFIEYLQLRIGLLNDAYQVHPLNELVFSYIIKEGECIDEDRRLLQDLTNKSITTHSFNNMNIPISMNPEDYGNILLSNKIDDLIRYIVNDNNRTYQIDITLDSRVNKVKILGKINLEWTDTKLNEGFMREIGKSTFTFLDGEAILRKQHLSAKPFNNLKPEKFLRTKFLTMDIETIKSNGAHIPYLISCYNGEEYITSYAKDTNNIDQKDLFNRFIELILKKYYPYSKSKFRKLIIYAHNLSGFDGIFLLTHLIDIGDVDPIINNGKLISIDFISKNGIKIIFKDSYLMLPESLRKLCKAFNIEEVKSYFPYLLNDIFYRGILPNISYWTNISLDEYSKFLNNFTGKTWDFKEEAIKYCNLDCKALHDILSKFNELIFSEFNVNMSKCLTLPALAMKIYKTHYMPEDSIYQILGDVEKDIRSSYTGGAVDVYITNNRIISADRFQYRITDALKKLFYYDVNSLYPTVMANANMPIGKPIRFEGDILRLNPEAFGFFYCKITSPKYLEHPILQRRMKTSSGLRTVAGLGTWEGFILSEEMNNAKKYGYKFEVIRGYEFQKGNLFKDYVNKMYELRLNYPKTNPMNLIAKLLMNSLYGKLSMKTTRTCVEIHDCSTEKGMKEFQEWLEIYGESIQDYIKFGEKYLIVRDKLSYEYDEEENMYHGLEVNVAIGSAITSYARIFMSSFKNNNNFNLYYSDTDSIIIDEELTEDLVGNKLGQLKLEHTIDKGIFLAPKVYGFETDKGDKIIKVKGIKNDITETLNINELEELLYKDSSREFTQEKWFKNLFDGEISTKDVIYTLKVNNNKRRPVYIDNKFVYSEPYYYYKDDDYLYDYDNHEE